MTPTYSLTPLPSLGLPFLTNNLVEDGLLNFKDASKYEIPEVGDYIPGPDFLCPDARRTLILSHSSTSGLSGQLLCCLHWPPSLGGSPLWL